MSIELFYLKMKKLLGEEQGSELINGLQGEINKGIRINKLKVDNLEFEKIFGYKLESISWCKDGYYYFDKNDRPSKQPYYYAGLFYLQEPSAMLPVEAMEIQPGDKVLDISAAPGGKSTQIAAKLQGEGILVSNDISPKRVIALHKNLCMFGVKNAVIFNQKPQKLAEYFENFFDKVLVDAPCSGEGLIKKDISNYENDNDKYVQMQREILSSVEPMIKNGGELVYSTCTFSPEENEGVIDWFIKKYPKFSVVDINIDELDCGKPEWIGGDNSLSKAKRAWPHKIRGEGHFLVKLHKKNVDTNIEQNNKSFSVFEKNIEKNKIELYNQFIKENYSKNYKGMLGERIDNLHFVENILWSVPEDLPYINGLKAISLGLCLGEIKGNKFVPSQELAMTLKKEDFNNIVSYNKNDIKIIKYLKGETIEVEGKNGWVLVCVDDYPLGFGKINDGIMKNYYKKQWRML